MITDHLRPTTYATPSKPAPRATSGALPRLRQAARSWLGIEPVASAVTVEDAPDLAEEHTDWPSIDVVYDEIQEMTKAQSDRNKIIDTKANFGLAAATLLTAGVTGLGRALSESGATVGSQVVPIGPWTPSTNQLVDGVTIASLVVFFLIALCTVLAYRIQTFRDVANPGKLMEVYLYKEPEYTKAALAQQRAKNFMTNEDRIDGKATWANRAMKLLVVEAGLLLLIAVLQVIWL
jgi:hypothetical protein